MTGLDKEKKDVEDVVDPDKKSKSVEDDDNIDDDKNNNLANLRKKLKTTEDELAIAKKQLEEKGSDNRTLGNEGEEEEEDKTKVKDKAKATEKKPAENEALAVVFQRDLKEATRTWNKKNKVTNEEWLDIKKKVALKGDETLSEILEKIDEAHNSLPSVRERREKEIFDKGRKAAMSDIQDDELDMGGSGGDIDLGDGGTERRVTGKTKKFAKAMGLTDKELKEVGEDQNPNEWTPGPQATRKFFQP
jgi:hypothetical protein